ncbi:AAA family ATPase [Tumidithrix elongata RA019]|uniref:AAA family ATPase n=1 Tax=Tumidithrix elongata BACA0141 TaxID=2716417 RepID=A0AAW9PX77_9CYAN|nr:AAA family ATPase [Tumidithrix elongata RA019]
MKFIVIGQSQSGKTTLAQHIAQTYGFQHISASDWVKQVWQLSVEDFASREDYIKAITEYSLEYLRKYPNACIDYIRDRLDYSDKTVIDGIRNPHDFVNLFDWRSDRCLYLNYQCNPIPTNSFERGLSVIQTYLHLVARKSPAPKASGDRPRFPSI